MITIRLFARLREQIGISQLQWPLDESIAVSALVKQLMDANGMWRHVAEHQVLCALNHQHVTFNAEVKPGDELAFFPPVTGG
ncbi:MoaD/ThiS family protein [Celerinatantimonas yamalensis]|uniref:Molybdopterin synthase sulfur carrier subunit n=1 Tax=Celerinatantimonas yamalensis TaxID=559956 RepID=A0ABW9G423_9GAMM